MVNRIHLTPYSIEELYRLHVDNPDSPILLETYHASGIGISVAAVVEDTKENKDITDYSVW